MENNCTRWPNIFCLQLAKGSLVNEANIDKKFLYLLSQGCGWLVNVLLKKLISSTLTYGLKILYQSKL